MGHRAAAPRPQALGRRASERAAAGARPPRTPVVGWAGGKAPGGRPAAQRPGASGLGRRAPTERRRAADHGAGRGPSTTVAGTCDRGPPSPTTSAGSWRPERTTRGRNPHPQGRYGLRTDTAERLRGNRLRTERGALKATDVVPRHPDAQTLHAPGGGARKRARTQGPTAGPVPATLPRAPARPSAPGGLRRAATAPRPSLGVGLPRAAGGPPARLGQPAPQGYAPPFP